MNLSKVKLVVSDMDGTLLNTDNQVSSLFFEQFEELQNRNIHFVAASGRQFQSIQDKLEPIKNKISIIAENGGIMQYQNKVDVLLKLSQSEIAHCIDILRTIDDCYIVLCGRKAAYIETDNQEFIDVFSKYYAVFEKVEDLTKINDDDFLKIAVYHFKSSEEYVFPHLGSLNDNYQVIVSGQNWLDISNPNANKGYALKILQENLGVSTDETLVFGDYNNDLQMLDLAHFNFAMENAHPTVKKSARFSTKSNSEMGVEYILDKLLKSIPRK